MAKIEIHDDCLEPDRYIYLSYKGPDPWAVNKKLAGLLRLHFHVGTSSVCNQRINWDIVGENISFYSVWWVKKRFTRNTRMRVEIKILGKKSKATNYGEFIMEINPWIQTEFSTWGFLLKPAWLIYSYLFYDRVRRKHIETCRNMIYTLRNKLKEHFNLTVTETTEAQGVYG